MATSGDRVRVSAYQWKEDDGPIGPCGPIDGDQAGIGGGVQVRPRKEKRSCAKRTVLNSMLTLMVIAAALIVFSSETPLQDRMSTALTSISALVPSVPSLDMFSAYTVAALSMPPRDPRLVYTVASAGGWWHFSLDLTSSDESRLQNATLVDIHLVLDCTVTHEENGTTTNVGQRMVRPLWTAVEEGMPKRSALAGIFRMNVDGRRMVRDFSLFHLFMNPATFQTMCEQPDEITVVAVFQLDGAQINAKLSVPFHAIAEIFTSPEP